MTHILDLESGKAWRSQWMPASFRGEPFHVETGVKESGRRIVPHEFPKRDIPYAEDMGRRAREFTVRGYIIVYPASAKQERPQQSRILQNSNYLFARDRLIEALEAEGPGILQLPLLGAAIVAVTRYRVTEESRLGGFCLFDMSFVEYGKAPAEGSRNTEQAIRQMSDEHKAAIKYDTERKLRQQQSRPGITTVT